MHCKFLIINRGDTRSIKAKKNIVASAILKGADTLVYLLLVPLTLGYLNAYEYGIWLTLNSFLSWINAFDIGLGSGLRNKLGEAMADNDIEKGRAYVSTTLFMLVFITLVIIAIGVILINLIDWYRLLKVDVFTVGSLKEIILASFFFFCINFVLKFVGNVYQALQLSAVNSLMSFSGHLLSLFIIFIFTKITPGSLFLVAIIYSMSPPLIYLLCYPITFLKLYPFLSPSLKYFRKALIKDLLSLSMLFFVFQVMGIVLFSLSNILISNLFGPDQVTPYNIAYRYFSILLMISNLLLAPIWSAATDASAKDDYIWIKKCVSKIWKLLFIEALFVLLMISLSSLAYKIWIGNQVHIPLIMSAVMGLYIFILLWSLCFSSILNGMSKLKLQAYNIVFQAILFYPICYILADNFGVTGVVLGMCIVNLPGAIFNTLQLKKILNRTASGIWNK